MKSIITVLILCFSPCARAAITERYVTQAAGGGGSGTSGSPWTLAEAVTNAVAGDRVNVKSDAAYTLGTSTFTAGTGVAPVIWRGYDTTIGDLDAINRAATGVLITTNFPDITITTDQAWSVGANVLFQNLLISGSYSGVMIGGNVNDGWGAIGCKITNTKNNAAAIVVQCDNDFRLYNCDLENTGAAHGVVADCDQQPVIYGCRFKGVDTDTLLTLDFGTVINCAFVGNSGGTNDGVQTVISGHLTLIGNTFYKLDSAVILFNGAASAPIIATGNHVTDCAKWIDSLYVTSNTAVFEIANRTRDVTTLLTLVDTSGSVANIADGATGDISTDYTDAGAGDLTLISSAPGQGAGFPLNTDIGAYQREEPAPGGGGGATAATFVQ